MPRQWMLKELCLRSEECIELHIARDVNIFTIRLRYSEAVHTDEIVLNDILPEIEVFTGECLHRLKGIVSDHI